MAANEFAPVTPGEMISRNFWPNTAFHKISNENDLTLLPAPTLHGVDFQKSCA
jgi:hypothetical protein